MSLKKEHSDQDCFIEDNTITQHYSNSRSKQQFRHWRIPGYGDRQYRQIQTASKGNIESVEDGSVIQRLAIQIFPQVLETDIS